MKLIITKSVTEWMRDISDTLMLCMVIISILYILYIILNNIIGIIRFKRHQEYAIVYVNPRSYVSFKVVRFSKVNKKKPVFSIKRGLTKYYVPSGEVTVTLQFNMRGLDRTPKNGIWRNRDKVFTVKTGKSYYLTQGANHATFTLEECSI